MVWEHVEKRNNDDIVEKMDEIRVEKNQGKECWLSEEMNENYQVKYEGAYRVDKCAYGAG